MSSKWTHSICSVCWITRNPGRRPATVQNAMRENCCFCGAAHGSGIYIREDPQELHCKGEHPAKQETQWN